MWSAHTLLALPEDDGAMAEKMCINHESADDGDSEDAKKMYLAACRMGRQCAMKAGKPKSASAEKCCKEITDAGKFDILGSLRESHVLTGGIGRPKNTRK